MKMQNAKCGMRNEQQGSGFGVQGSQTKIVNFELQIVSCKLPRERPSPLAPLPKGEGMNTHPSSFILHPSSLIPHPSSLTLHPFRRGITLMEVLISIFVLSIGLLGVAAIIPLGQLALWETAKADRCGACGRAALREIQVGRMLDFRYWYWLPGPTTPPPPTSWQIWGFYPPFNLTTVIPDIYSSVAGGSNFDSMPFALDPLGRARGMPEVFGFYPGSPTTPTSFLPRRTLRSTPLAPSPPPPQPPPPMLDAVAEQLFIWNDDLPFYAPRVRPSGPCWCHPKISPPAP